MSTIRINAHTGALMHKLMMALPGDYSTSELIHTALVALAEKYANKTRIAREQRVRLLHESAREYVSKQGACPQAEGDSQVCESLECDYCALVSAAQDFGDNEPQGPPSVLLDALPKRNRRH